MIFKSYIGKSKIKEDRKGKLYITVRGIRYDLDEIYNKNYMPKPLQAKFDGLTSDGFYLVIISSDYNSYDDYLKIYDAKIECKRVGL